MSIHPDNHFDNTSKGNGASGNTGAFDQDEYDFDIARVAALPLEKQDIERKKLAEKYAVFGIKLATIKKQVKEACDKLAADERARVRKEREAQRARGEKAADGRVRCEAPYPDGPRTEVMRLLDKALTTEEAEPPMRDLYWAPTEARMRAPTGVHLLTAESANAEEEGEVKRLPPPPVLSLVPHDKYSLGLLIEKYVEFYKIIEMKNGDTMEVAVALAEAFVNAFLAYRNSKLPRVWTIATMPIVLPNGEILATDGLDRKRKILSRIDPGIRELLPQGKITGAEIVEAMNFLTDEWLCDVQTEYAGKCVLISMALSILQRALFSARPMYNVTAGKAEGGKTTATNMVSCAVTGSPAAAAAWSNDPEERRKTIFALSRQNLPMVVFDNIPRGYSISCSHLEKALTAEVIEDRVLGTSDTEVAPSSTIFIITGNATTTKGDLASRTLVCRIVVDRPDPANREFRHPEPIDWTLDHRGEVLKALYTILLGNPRLAQKKKDRTAAKTRFKDWWASIGAAIEHAAKLVSDELENAGKAGHTVDFGELIALSKGEDEEASSLVEGLEALDRFAAKEKHGVSFPASLVAHMWLTSCGEDGEILKSFLRCKPDGTLPTKTVSARLRAHVDEPVDVGGEVWTLKMSMNTVSEVMEFHVHKRKR
jgi:hypothetical protein